MDTNKIRDLIPDYVRGMLSPNEAAEVQAALEAHPELKQECLAAQRYYAALDKLPQVKASPDFIDCVNRAIDRQGFWRRLGSLLFKPSGFKVPLELAGVATCLVAVVVIFKPFSVLQQGTIERLPEHAVLEQQYDISGVKGKAASENFTKTEVLAAKQDKAEAVLTDKDYSDQKAIVLKKEALIARRAGENDLALGSAGKKVAQAPAAQPRKSLTDGYSKAEDYASSARSAAPVPATMPTEVGQKATLSDELGPSSDMAAAAVDIGTIEVAYATVPVQVQRAKFAEETPAARAVGMAQHDMAEAENADYKKDELSAFSKVKKAPAKPARASSVIPLHAPLDSILLRYDPSLMAVKQNGATAYTLTLTPDRLAELKARLARSARLTVRTREFDPQQTKKVKVTLVLIP